MKVSGVLVARMGSDRLPGKVMLPLCGKPVVWHCARRIEATYPVQEMWLLASEAPEDEPLIEYARSQGWQVARNPGDDLAEGYGRLHRIAKADIYLQASCDCPLADTEYPQLHLQAYMNGRRLVWKHDPDIVWLNVGQISVNSAWEVQIWADRCDTPFLREHPGTLLLVRPDLVWQLPLSDMALVEPSEEEYRWRRKWRVNLDEYADAYVIGELYHALYREGQIIKATQAIAWLDAHPEVRWYNSHVQDSAVNMKSYTDYAKAQPDWGRIVDALRAYRDPRNKIQWCKVCRGYLGYVREEAGVQWFHLPSGVRLRQTATVKCPGCGSLRFWAEKEPWGRVLKVAAS